MTPFILTPLDTINYQFKLTFNGCNISERFAILYDFGSDLNHEINLPLPQPQNTVEYNRLINIVAAFNNNPSLWNPNSVAPCLIGG